MVSGVVVAIDPGTRYIGVAVSDPDGTLASPRDIIDQKSEKDYLSRLVEIIAAEKADTILIGKPLSLKGSTLPMTKATEAFAEKLRTLTEVPIKFVDERLSTKIALEGTSRGRADSNAAAVFLQNYLDQQR